MNWLKFETCSISLLNFGTANLARLEMLWWMMLWRMSVLALAMRLEMV